jgi:precorrin-2 dehydrogenase/sirohydrochlorin ferrochelatase
MSNQKKKHYFPILIELEEFSCLVIGGGNVALRKINNLLEFGHEGFTVIAPKVHPEILRLASMRKINLKQRQYETGDAKGYRLVFAATDNPEVDEIIRRDCDETGSLLNVADVPDLCNFIMPATIKRGEFIAAFSSQGRAPFLAKKKKDDFELLLSPMVADVAALAGDFRDKLMGDARFESPDKRYELFQKFLMVNWERVLYEEGPDGAEKIMEKLFE